MRYFVNLEPADSPSAQTPGGSEPIVVDLVELPSGALEAKVGGQPVQVDVASIGDDPRAGAPISVRVNGRVVDLTTEGQPPELGAIANGHRTYVRVESERQRAAAAAKKGGGGANDKLVKSPMPGRVIKMLVKAGDEVAVGQTMCVVEAMKMENEVKAKAAGTIGDVHVKEGATVEANAKLISFA